MINPFVTNGYAGPEYFCDRVQETAILRDLLLNENNVALISPRRLGKTGLIWHVFNNEDIRNSHYCFVVDIYATKNLSDFVNMLGKAVIDELRPKGKKAWEKFINIVSSLRSEISFDVHGVPSWNMGLGTINNNPAVTLDEIFSYLNQADKPCLVAIDEYQQITKYEDDTIEATIRTYVQRCTNAHFIFSGSQRHIMNGMFTSPSRPFYQSVTIMNLQPLDLEVYTDFCVGKFEEADKRLDRNVVALLYNRFDAVTSYMHRILNVLYSKTEKGQPTGRPPNSCFKQIISNLCFSIAGQFPAVCL
jgi:AAA+ ATPase superfamily predicted ATPase